MVTRAWRAIVHPARDIITPGARYSIIVLSVVFLVLTAASYELATRNAATITQLCQAGNESRAQQIILWEHIIHVSVPPPHETAAQRATRLAVTRSFEVYLRHVFAPRNCAHPATAR